MFFTELSTNRLTLKNAGPDDREIIFRQFSDETVCRYLYDEEPFSDISQADSLIELFTQPEPRSGHRWILVLKDSGEKIGTCGFHFWDRQSGKVQIGYDMQKAHWGHGYMTEAASRILIFAKDSMKVNQVDAHVSVDNAGSSALCRRLGFTWEGETVIYPFRGKDYLHNVWTLRFPQP